MKEFIFKNIRLSYREGTADEKVIMHSFENDIFYKNVPEIKLKKLAIVFDIGAHIGTFSLYSTYLAKNAKVYAFEPCLDTFNILNENINRNNLTSNIIPIREAISNNEGTTELFYDLKEGNWGHSIVKALSEKSEIVKTNTLKYYFNKFNIEHCDLIKFNCEGAEFDIILSSPVETLKKVKYLLILYHEDLSQNHNASELKAKLNSAGFYTEFRFKTEKRGWLIAIRSNMVILQIRRINYIFRESYRLLKTVIKSIISK